MMNTAQNEKIIVNKKEWEKMKKEVTEMKDMMYGPGGDSKPQIVHDIISGISNKIDTEKIDSRQVSLLVMDAIIIFLCVTVIFLIVYFQSQLADVSQFLPIE